MSSDAWQSASPAVLISVSRGGGTFLCHCLDSHPEICCERAEPLSSNGPWMSLDVPRSELMRVLWDRPGYRTAMFKLTYRQARWYGMEAISSVGARVIHLHREDALRVVTSAVINTAHRDGKFTHHPHAYETPSPPPPVRIDPEWLLAECRRYRSNVALMLTELRAMGVPLLALTYAEVVGGEGNQGRVLSNEVRARVCDFLNIDGRWPMMSLTARVNPWPLAGLIENWDEVREALLGSEFERWL